MKTVKLNKMKGVTIIELMVTLAVAAVLVASMVPSMSELIANNRMSTESGYLLDAFLIARSEAIKRGTTVSICSSTDGSSCAGDDNWAVGWLVWEDTDNDGVPDNTEEVLQVHEALTRVTAQNQENADTFKFDSGGFTDISAGSSLNFDICDDRTGEEGRTITVSPSGKVSKSYSTCS